MEYVLNWMVLILSLGGIALVVMLCYSDLVRNTSRVIETQAPVADYASEPAVAAVEQPDGRFVELQYSKDGAVEFVQRVDAGRKGYIGTESYQQLGTGMPVRYVEIDSSNGGFEFTNLDWQSPVQLKTAEGTETEAQVGQSMPLEDGAQLLLSGGWTVTCRISEEGNE